MGRAPCCDKTKVKTGPWSQEEDLKLIRFVAKHGHSNWRSLPRQAGLLRCGKSCRLRWINYLRPDVKRGNFTAEEEETIINLQRSLGNKWSKIASQLPGRTDNEIKNVWNTHLKKRLMSARETNSSTTDHMNHQSTDDSSPQRMIQEPIDHHQFNNPNSHQKQPDDHLHEQPRSETPLSLSSSSSTPDLSPATSNASESFEIDDVWEMLESLDSLGASQSSTDLHFDGLFQDMEYEYSEVELHKWLRFFEEELGIASEDADNVGKRIM